MQPERAAAPAADDPRLAPRPGAGTPGRDENVNEDLESARGRRAAARRARDAFPPMGVYAIRDRRTGAVRVACSRNVHAAINRTRFELRLGSHPDRTLQSAWRDGGEERFAFEVLELVKERSEPGFDHQAELHLLLELHRAEHAPGGMP